MKFNFPAAGSYPLVLDFFENGGGEEVEFFQTNSSGENRRLINVDSELVVFRDDVAKINATDIVVVDDNTIRCLVDLTGVEPGAWGVTVTPECGDIVKVPTEDGLRILACSADFNSDTIVNFADWAELADRWLDACTQPDWCEGTDLDESGGVDTDDVAIFSAEWLKGG